MIQSVRDATLSILLARCLVFPRPVTSIQCAKSTIPLFLKKAEIGQGWPKDGIKSTARSAKAINGKSTQGFNYGIDIYFYNVKTPLLIRLLYPAIINLFIT